MTTLEGIFFAICTLLVLMGGVFTVAAKNPIRGAMGLLCTIVGIAGMYLLLTAELLAAIQVVVYAGAVVILFLFVIMLLGPAAAGANDARGAVARYIGAALFLPSLGGILYVVMFMGKELTQMKPAPAAMGTIDLIGREMFTRGVVPFQIAGVLLLIAVVGAMSVAKGNSSTRLHIKTRQSGSAVPRQPEVQGEGKHAKSGLVEGTGNPHERGVA